MAQEFDISLLLATRGRTDALGKSVRSLFELADNPHRLQIMFGFDKDDDKGKTYFQTELQPWLDSHGYHYTAMVFDPLGYIRLHIYNNKMAEKALAPWFVIWNDDAIMQTQGWDSEILKYNGKFRLLAFHTHNDHPYSIFPIVPRKWYDLLGYISPHPTQDGWLSQQAYMLDIWERIPVWVEHDRHDLTGNNGDETFKNRAMLEGRPDDPLDFHSVQQMDLRHRDCTKLATYMRGELDMDLSFFTNVFNGTQDPWEKLAQNDVNSQMVQFANPHTHFAKKDAGQKQVNNA
jgi:hypothetical protein